MSQLIEDKRPNGQRKIFTSVIQTKVVISQEKKGNKSDIRILFPFLYVILLISISIDMSLKFKGYKIKDINFNFDYNIGNKNTERYDLNFKRDYPGIDRRKNQDILLNPLLLFDFPREITTKSLHTSQIKNTLYIISCDEISLLDKKSCQIKCNHNIFYKLSNMKKKKMIII